MTAGKLQSEHPNPCQLSADGHFGSKFVTVVMTGDKENQIQPEGYQVRGESHFLRFFIQSKTDLSFIDQSINRSILDWQIVPYDLNFGLTNSGIGICQLLSIPDQPIVSSEPILDWSIVLSDH